MATTKAIQIFQRRCINVLATNLLDGEQFVAEYALVSGCEPLSAKYMPYYEDGVRVVLDTTHNPLTLWRPGWYRFVIEDGLNPLAAVESSEPFDCSIDGPSVNNVATVP